MFKIQIISVFILILNVLKSHGHPSPRISESSAPGPPQNRDQYKEYIEYVDVGGEGEGGAPEERYEIIDTVVGDPIHAGAYSQPNAEVVEDVDLNQFDQNGNYIGVPVSNEQAQAAIPRITEDIPKIQYIQMTKDEFNKAISDNNQDYYENEKEEDINSDNKPIITDLEQKTRSEKFGQLKPQIPKKDPYQLIEEKYPGIFKSLNNKNLNEEHVYQKKDEQDQLAHSMIENKETEYEYIEDEPEVIYDSDSDKTTEKITTEKITTEEITTEESSEHMHMDIHPALNTHDHVVIKQVSGPKGEEPGAVQITEQKVYDQTSTPIIPPVQLEKDQAKYDETVFKPKRKPRILARYKVIIPVIVPNLRIRYPSIESTTKSDKS